MVTSQHPRQHRAKPLKRGATPLAPSPHPSAEPAYRGANSPGTSKTDSGPQLWEPANPSEKPGIRSGRR